MFKANLIENPAYYKLKARSLIWMIVPAVAIGYIVGSYGGPALAVFLGLGILLLFGFMLIKNQKSLRAMGGSRIIEIDDAQIRIKSTEGTQQESIDLNNVDKIILKEKYGLPEVTMTEIANEIKGKSRDNYVIIQQENQQRQFDFEFQSSYMVNQLNQIIDNWVKKGYPVERASMD